MKKILICIMTILATLTSTAQTFNVGGLNYNILSDNTVEVSRTRGASGDIVIPSTVTNDETDYSVTSIGYQAFYFCRNLKSISIPNTVTSISISAFEDCSGLTIIEIPNSVTEINDHTFSGCSSLERIVIPSSITSIGVCAFMNCSNLTSVEIPNSVTSIRQNAFMNSGLINIEIPNSITSIETKTFMDCGSLTNVTIGNSVTSIEEQAFIGCTKLKNLNFNAEKCETCYESSFPTSIRSAEFGDKVSVIPSNLLYDCSGLTTVEIPNSVTSIGDYAFYHCTKLTSLDIPNSVTSIGNSAFSGCTGLTSLDIPNSVNSIGRSAFAGCIRLTDITIGSSVTSIGDYVFYNCTGLISLAIPNSVSSIEYAAFAGCSNLATIEISNSVTSIGDYAFYHCTGLSGITIPNSVISIGYRAFYGCRNLTSLIMGYGVSSIGERAFADCSSLSTIYITTEQAPKSEASNIFSNYTAELYILTSAKASFQSGTGWENFSNSHPLVKATSLTVDKTHIKGYGNEEIQITATVSPDNVTLKEVFWTSDDINAATVDNNGKITIKDPYICCTIKAESIYPGVEPAYITVNGTNENPEDDWDAVESVKADSDILTDVFNLNGVCLKRGISHKDFDVITPGIYIIRGKKVVIR